MTATPKQLEDLKFWETAVTMAVCDVRGYVSQGMADNVDRLRALTGMRFDAINGKFSPLSPQDVTGVYVGIGSGYEVVPCHISQAGSVVPASSLTVLEGK